MVSRILANIPSLKFNFKLGGTNHQIEGNLSVIKPKTLLVGADVTHGGKTDDSGCPSLAGVVASCGQIPSASFAGDFHRYLASARMQSKNTEVSRTFLSYIMLPDS